MLLTSVAGAADNPIATDPMTPRTISLDRAISDSLRVDPSVQSARAQMAQAQAVLGEADAGRRLQISFTSAGSASSTDVYQPPPSHETFGTLQNSITVPIPVGRRPALAVEQADEQLSASQAQYESARYDAILRIIAGYYDLLRKKALLASAQQSLDLANRQLSDAQKRNSAGDVAQIDVLQAETPVASAQAGVQQAATDVAVADQTLNDLIGQPLDAQLIPVDPGLPDAPLYSLDEARAMAMRASPSVAAADALVRADSAGLNSSRLYGDPALSLQASDARSGDRTGFLREDVVQAQITIPISDGGLGASQVKASQAALSQALAERQSARKAVLAAVSAAYLNAQGSAVQLSAAMHARDIARTTYDKTIEGYQNGLFPLVDVLTAENALNQASNTLVRAQYDAESSRRSLDIAVSGGAEFGADSKVDGSLTPVRSDGKEAR
jgi:multidrug efflux system outer membrane protein